MRVTHGYLAGPTKEEGAPLFASHHFPAGGARNVAYVLCPPLHLDLIQSHRSMRRCAEVLADAGFHVLRIHYEGTMESPSSTDLEPGRVAAWLASVRRAVSALEAVPGVEHVGLIGVRIGAAFALDASTHLEVAQLVLWEPSNGNFYGREMEILASSSPQPEPPLGEGVVAGGYWLSKETLADLAKVDMEKTTPRGKPDTLLVYRSDRKPMPRLQQHLERSGLTVTLAQPAGHKEMMQMPQRSAVPVDILETIKTYALEHSKPAAVRIGDLPLLPAANVDGITWSAVRFGVANHLFGVLTEPAAGAKKPAVLLLTGGVTPRTAGNNSYVTLARALARRGHTVLRMDVSAIGESGTPDGSDGRENEPYPSSILDDARAGLERVLASSKEAWVFGLCSGAFAGFHVALGDERVKGAILVNPERFDMPTPQAVDAPAQISTVDQMEQVQHWLRQIRSPDTWKRLAKGDIEVRHAVRVIGARVSAKAAALQDRVAVRLGREAKGLAADIAKMLARDVRVHLVFSEGDPGQVAITSEIGPRLAELEAKGLVVTTFARADHNFHEMSSRAKMLDWTLATIDRAPG